MTKVRTAVLFVVMAAAAGCDRASEPVGGPDAERFGNPYQIVTNVSAASPDEPPAIVSDSLLVMVTYAGGCADHGFELASNLTGDTAEVWLVHDSGGEACEALIRDHLQLPVPEQVLSAARIHLLNPNAEVPFVVRWEATDAPRSAD